jgi:hypothetical protein
VAFQESVKPISFGEESGLMYNRWIRKMNQITENWVTVVGYVHVQGMNDGSFFWWVKFRKEALIVDTRFNGGGWLRWFKYVIERQTLPWICTQGKLKMQNH